MSFLKTTIKLYIIPNNVTATPPIGPILSQNGINAIEFCKHVNELSVLYAEDFIIPVLVLLYSDFSYVFFIKTPSFFVLIKKFLSLPKQSSSFFFKKKKKKKNYILAINNMHLHYYTVHLRITQLIELAFLLYNKKASSINIFNIVKMYQGTLHSGGIYQLQY